MLRKNVITTLVTVVTVLTAVTSAYAQFPTHIFKARPLYQSDTVTLCVLGDIMMHTEQIRNARKPDNQYEFSSYFELIQDKIKTADIAIANMEFTLAGEPHTGYPAFSAPDSYAKYLAESGFDIFLIANNHIFDKGSTGADRTLEIYKELSNTHGIRYCGLAADQVEREQTHPLIVKTKGISIALVNFTYGTNLGADKHWPKVNYMNERSMLKTAMDKASEADFTLVLPHWGNEYELTHSPEQHETAKWLIDNGADMIIGTHPHVVQDCETIDDVQVAYSLGNAVSNMSAANTQVELMAEIRLVRDSSGDIKILPIRFTWLWCSRPGGYNNSYTVLPIHRYLDSRDRWAGPWEYDKMLINYERVRKATKIDTLQ